MKSLTFFLISICTFHLSTTTPFWTEKIVPVKWCNDEVIKIEREKRQRDKNDTTHICKIENDLKSHNLNCISVFSAFCVSLTTRMSGALFTTRDSYVNGHNNTKLLIIGWPANASCFVLTRLQSRLKLAR